MEALGLTEDMIQKLLDTMAMTDLDALEAVLGGESPALCQIKQLFAHAEAYGYKDWLVFDASVVRGLAYYTGLVFEGFDRKGTLRAICGGGRYDKLLETFGGTAVPAVGFGFGDAVIVELLKDKGVLPSFTNAHVDAVVYPFSRAQFGGAAAVAATLRSADVSVDLVLEEKKTKWLWKQADRVSARFVVLLGEDEAHLLREPRGDVHGDELLGGQSRDLRDGLEPVLAQRPGDAPRVALSAADARAHARRERVERLGRASGDVRSERREKAENRNAGTARARSAKEARVGVGRRTAHGMVSDMSRAEVA